jgi:hypothetical protein
VSNTEPRFTVAENALASALGAALFASFQKVQARRKAPKKAA